MDIEELLAPVSVEAPCGEDLAFSSELDAIARARQADDPSLEQGAWVTALKEADWKFVAGGCSRLLKTRSKDLRLAVWLAEAAARTAGLRALGDALLVTAGLCQRYWEGLYPLAEEGDHEQRIGNLAWVAARVAQLLRELAVTEGPQAYCLNDFASARGHAAREIGAPVPDLDGARRRTPAGFYRRLLDDCAHCDAALAELQGVVDARLGADGPGFTAARENLQDLVHFATPLAGTEDGAAAAPPPPPLPELGAPMPNVVVRNSGALQSRAQALEQLRAVATFFRQTEPHSPVAYLADKAAHWGEQPLHVWLRAVIKDDAMYAQLEEMLGAGKPAA